MRLIPRTRSARISTAGVATLLTLSAAGFGQTTWWVDDDADCSVGDGSQGTPFCRIQDGINAAVSGDTVLVGTGSYAERINFGGRNIAVRSDADWNSSTHDPDRSGTIIDGGAGGSVVRFVTGESRDAVLEGFTIRNGQAQYGGGIHCSGSDPTIVDNIIEKNLANHVRDGASAYAYGGGVYCVSASPLFQSNLISANYTYAYASQFGSTNRNAYAYGGGIYCSASAALFEDNEITENYCSGGADGTLYRRGGGFFITSSSVVVHDNVIQANTGVELGGGFFVSSCGSGLEISGNRILGNTAGGGSAPNGGGIYCTASSPRILDNTFTGNGATSSSAGSGHGGALCIVSNSSPTLARNSVYVNSATGNGGGIFVGGSTGSMINNLLLCNTADYGAGIHLNDDTAAPVFRNNTLWGNEASVLGGGIYHAAPPATWKVWNLIAWSNLAAGVRDQIQPNTVNVCYSDIEGGWGTGTDNIDLDPRFVNARCDQDGDQNEDFDFRFTRLQLRDIGDPNSPPGCEKDRGGCPRLLDSNLDGIQQVDPGAHEYTNVTLSATGDWTPGGTVTVTLDAPNGMNRLLAVGLAAGEANMKPYGCFYLDFSQPWSVYPMGANSWTIVLPTNIPTPLTLVLQGLGTKTSPKAGNTSCPIEVTIQ